MSAHAQAVTLHLPASLYDHVKRRAAESRRSVEAELLQVVETAIPQEQGLSPELAEAVSALAHLTDEELWSAARTRLAPEAGAQLESLHFKQQSEGLSEEEEATDARLLREYERVMLVRAEAARLLKDRGYDVSSLLTGR